MTWMREELTPIEAERRIQTVNFSLGQLVISENHSPGSSHDYNSVWLEIPTLASL